MTRAGGQLGDLQGLASGDLSAFGPTSQDKDLIAQSLGFAGDQASRQLERLSSQGQANLTEQLTATGQQDASIESVKRALMETSLGDQLANLISQQGIAGGQALMNLPFQRAQVALGANQSLFQQLSGAANPALQSLLQGRLAQGTQTTTQPFITGGDLLGAGASFAKRK